MNRDSCAAGGKILNLIGFTILGRLSHQATNVVLLAGKDLGGARSQI